MFVGCECCVLSGRGLCDGRSLVQRSPANCGCVAVCDRMVEEPSTPTLVNQKEAGLRKKKERHLN